MALPEPVRPLLGTPSTIREVVRCGCSGLWLLIGLPLAIVLQALLSWLFNGDGEPEPWQLVLVFGMAFLGAGALWAWSLTRSTGATATRRTMLAGALGYAIASVASIFALNYVEEHSHLFLSPVLRIHHLFMLVFTLAAGLITGVGGATVGWAIGGWRLAGRMGVVGALVGSAAWLAVALLMDLLLGYRVGAPGAEERFTMVTVAFLGVLATAVVGSVALGLSLKQGQRSRGEG